ncbi:MAG: S8 family serine peptidase [Blastocatellia bacterium]
MSYQKNRFAEIFRISPVTRVVLAALLLGGVYLNFDPWRSVAGQERVRPAGGDSRMEKRDDRQVDNKFRKAQRPISGRYIVVLNDEEFGLTDEPLPGQDFIDSLPREEAQALAQRVEKAGRAVAERAEELVETHKGAVRGVFTHSIRGFVAELGEDEARRLSEDPRVMFVEEDGEVSINVTQANPPWGLDRIDQRALPLNRAYNYQTTGSGVHAYVIDSGIRPTHREFGGRATADADFSDAPNGGIDCLGHGTHVAGTLGGATFGVAKNVRLHAVRVFSCTGITSDSRVIAGVDWVTAHHIKPAVANMSLGNREGDPPSEALEVAVRRSIAAGITYVVAAGNDGIDATPATSPARVTEAITVGSVDRRDTRASTSNFGEVVDVFAPGVGIRSAWIDSDANELTISGTSMAAPHVAGAVALFLERQPNALPAYVQEMIKNSATAGIVQNPGFGSPNRLLYGLITPLSGSGNLYAVSRQGGSGTTEVHLLNAAGNFRNFLLQTPTALHQTGAGNEWEFLVGDYNRDGRPDLYVIARQGGSGTTEVHVLNGADNFSTWLLHTATALHQTGSGGEWEFELGDYNRDGRLDLYAILRLGGSGTTEVHVLNGADSFSTFLLHTATTLPQTGAGNESEFKIGDYNRDGKPDLILISRLGGSGTTEVHVLSGADNFRTWLLHTATALPLTGAGFEWDFMIGDYNRDNRFDLYAIARAGGSGATEVHVLDGANNFGSYLMEVATALHRTGADGAWRFAMQ